ncbi:MAG: ATP-binding protein [Proteobacteria bacterium]|nr:ATP-binding protein [Pseudomonadota bacterium]
MIAEKRASILAIDDVPANLLALGLALSPEFDLQVATTGLAGLKLAAALPPDLILLDVLMPDMDGYEICRQLKADPRLMRIPVIFITGLVDSDAEAAGLALGAADYLTKPIQIDITRQRIRNLLERERLADRNIQLDALFSLSPDGIVALDHDDRVRFVNPAFRAMTGIAAGTIVGAHRGVLDQALRELCEQAQHFPGLASYLSNAARAPWDQVLTLSQPHPVVLKIAGIQSELPGIASVFYLRDITREAEVDRMKSEFLAHAAHELRTPMTGIYGFSELLLEMELDETTRRDLIKSIHSQTERLVDIVNELLDLARIDGRHGLDLKLCEVDPAALVSESLDSLAIDESRWPVKLEWPGSAKHVVTDPAKLRQALLNLLTNARKYSPAGGEIHVAIVEKPGTIGIAVRDHGIGMTPQQASRYGERFWRADTSGSIPGTGLGVAIVKEIMKLLGGSLELTSQVGHGTCITLWLPDTEDSLQPLPTLATLPTPPTLATYH